MEPRYGTSAAELAARGVWLACQGRDRWVQDDAAQEAALRALLGRSTFRVVEQARHRLRAYRTKTPRRDHPGGAWARCGNGPT